jgi:hypothetical protein
LSGLGFHAGKALRLDIQKTGIMFSGELYSFLMAYNMVLLYN